MTCRACKHPTHKPGSCPMPIDHVWEDGMLWDIVCQCVPYRPQRGDPEMEEESSAE